MNIFPPTTHEWILDTSWFCICLHLFKMTHKCTRDKNRFNMDFVRFRNVHTLRKGHRSCISVWKVDYKSNVLLLFQVKLAKFKLQQTYSKQTLRTGYLWFKEIKAVACWPQMPSSWLSSGYNLSQLFMAANPQGSAYFHSPLHHFKSDPLSLDSKHVLVSSLGFGPPQSNTIPLLLVFCPSGRQEQEKTDKMSKMKREKDAHVQSKPLLKSFCSVPQEQILELEVTAHATFSLLFSFANHMSDPHSRGQKIHSVLSQCCYFCFF